MLTIRQPVAVKMILTEATKQQILMDCRRQIDRVTAEIDQIDTQGTQALEQALAQGGDAAQQIRARLDQERATRNQQREQLIQQIQTVQQLELGTEVQNMNVETSVEVRVGDDWAKVLRGAEIILKDGIVHDIRRGGDSLSE